MGRLAVVIALVLCMVACSGSSSQGARNVKFVVSSFDVEGVAPNSHAADSARAGVTETLESYANEVVLPALRAGGTKADLRLYFSAAAGARAVSAPDRAAFVDEDLPPAAVVKPTGSYPSVALVGLVGPNGQVEVVTARFRLTLEATGLGTPLTIDRQGDLALVKDGAAWHIDSYAVTVTRDAPGGRTTTTASG
jgi:hypothetical protein